MREVVALVSAQAASPGADPDVAGLVLVNRVDIIGPQAVAIRIDGDDLFSQSIEAIIVGPDPERTFTVFIDRPDVITGQALGGSKDREPAFVESDQPAIRAQPQSSAAV